MGTKIIFLVTACCCFSFAALSQAVVFINAGSRASWGTNQELTIDDKGQCTYYLREVNGPVKDSSFFHITAAQLDSFFSKAGQVNFFGLNSKYDVGALDGAGIYISLNSSGKKHSVQLRNTDVPAVNDLVTFLNELLAPHKIRIYYGQSSPNK